MKKAQNQNRYAVWVDKKKAMIYKFPFQGTPEFLEMKSDVQTRPRFTGEETNKIGMLGTTISQEKKKQERVNNSVHKFTKKIVGELKDSNAILIMGSGDTRFELQNEINKSKLLNGVWVENKACKKLSQRELELEAKKHFSI